MESWSKAHTNLQELCAQFWPSAEDCLQILAEMQITSTRINMQEPSRMRWLSMIREFMRKDDGSMGRLVKILMGYYPDNHELANVCAPWVLEAPAQTQRVVPPPVIKKPVKQEEVTVKLPPTLVEDADLLCPSWMPCGRRSRN